MFTQEELFKILEFLRSGEIDTELDDVYRKTAQSEQITSSKYFENVLDQGVYVTDDYNRLRSLIIDWYASLKTLSKVSRDASNVYSLPSEHIDELLQSFGYNYSYNLFPRENKANFLLDLVNFYKRKGTIETLVDVLDYYGYSDSSLVEFWLIKNNAGNLVFRPRIVRESALGVNLESLIEEDIPYASMTNVDPHWLYTAQQIEDLISANEINLPSKSPYFSMSFAANLDRLNAVMGILSRVAQYEYDRYNTSLELRETVSIPRMGIETNFLTLYLAWTYVFQRMYGSPAPHSSIDHIYYTGTLEDDGASPPLLTNLDDILTEYETAVATIPTTRDGLKAHFESINTDWNETNASHFLHGDTTTAGTILQVIEPDLYDTIETYFLNEDETNLITYLTDSLDLWISSNIYSNIPRLITTTLGFGIRDDVKNIINFFKPYRSRLSSFGVVYSLRDYLRWDDEITFPWMSQLLEETGLCPYYGSGSDAYGNTDVSDNLVLTSIVWDPFAEDNIDWHRSPTLSNQSHTESISNGPVLEYNSEEWVATEVSAGGFADFDEGQYYDSPHGSDLCTIYIKE